MIRFNLLLVGLSLIISIQSMGQTKNLLLSESAASQDFNLTSTDLSVRNYRALNQFIDIDFVDVPLENALQEVVRLGGLRLAYSKDIGVDWDQPVSLQADQITVLAAVYAVLAEVEKSNVSLVYSRYGQLILTNGEDEEQLPPAAQEQGNIEGYITDAATGELLIGANIILDGMSIGTAADVNGYYSLKNVPAGVQVFKVQYLGYITHREEIEVIPGETVEHNFSLEADILSGEEIAVYHQALGQARAIRTQMASNSIVNVVSESRIRDMPDATAAESVGRLPGVSIIRDGGEATNVAIRGMSSRYNNITVAGDLVPSTGYEGRSVDLDFLSQEMLSGIELYKSNRPDQDANAIGGTVNFSLAKIREDTRFRVDTKGGYSDHIDELSNYGLSFSGSSRLINNRLGVSATFDIARNDRSSDEFSSGYEIVRDARPGEPHAPIAVTRVLGHTINATNDRIGGSVMLDWDTPTGTIFLSNYGSRLNRDEMHLERHLINSQSEQRWRLNSRDVEVDVLSNRLSGEHRIRRLADSFVEWRVSHSVSTRSHPFDQTIQFTEISAIQSGFDVEGNTSELVDFLNNNHINTPANSHWVDQTSGRERDLVGQFDITVPYQVSSQLSGNFKFGGKHTSKYRNHDNTELRFFFPNYTAETIIEDDSRDDLILTPGTGIERISMMNYIDPGFSRENIFLDGRFGFPFGLDRNLVARLYDDHTEKYKEDYSGRSNNHDAVERISAAYFMTEIDIGPRLMFMPGVRYEYTHGDYEGTHVLSVGGTVGGGSANDSSSVESYDNWFPMFQLRYQFADWFSIRAAYTKSSARPTFREIIPRQIITPNGESVVRSNHNLRPTLATNYDLFFVFSSNRIGLFSLGGFYKDIDDLIYDRTRTIRGDYEELGLRPNEDGYTLTEPYNNPLSTTVRGAEIEWQSNLTWLPRPFNGLVLNANLTLMDSETQYPEFEFERTMEGNVLVDTFRIGSMHNQPDYITNVSAGYDYRGFSLRVTMLYQGKQLYSIGNRPENDIYTTPIHRWDAILRQQLFGDRLSVFMNFQNISNEVDGANRFTRAYPVNRQYYGRAFDLGLRYTF